MKKRRLPPKHVRRKRTIRGLLVVGLLLCTLISFPLVWHLKEIRVAQDRYDLQKLTEEMLWVEEKIPLLKKFPLVRDSALWVKLNRGQTEEAETELAKLPDDKHRFWLFQLYLSTHQVDEARGLILNMESSSLRHFAEGLLAMEDADLQSARDSILSIKDSEIHREEQILKYLTLSRIEMNEDQFEKAEEYVNQAKTLSPQYPLTWITEYDLLLAREEWEQARQFQVKLEGIPGYAERPDFLIKKALLALTLGEREVWNDLKRHIGDLENGESYQEYMAGIEAYEQGQFEEAKVNFKNSLEQDLPNPFRKDAEKALTQASERVEAERALEYARKQ